LSAAPPAATHGPPIDVTLTCFASAQASSEQKDHPPAHAFDENPKTAWNDQAPDGAGQWVEARLRPGTWVDHVEVGGGWSYTTADGTDLWPLNSTFKTMHVVWDGGSADVQFDRASDRGAKKNVPIGAVTSTIRFSATTVDRGKYADLCLDDVIVVGSCASTCDATASACADGLFVQLATPQSSTPDTYDYPITRKMLKGHPDFVGVRVVEATRNGQRVMGAIVKNQCQADAIVRLATGWHVIKPSSSCDKVEVRHEVWTVDAAMGADTREPPPPAPAAGRPPCPAGWFRSGACDYVPLDQPCECFKPCDEDSDCPAGQKCLEGPPSMCGTP
jgi:hypothetical protein